MRATRRSPYRAGDLATQQPLLGEYHIDPVSIFPATAINPATASVRLACPRFRDRALVGVLQRGLSLVSRPFEAAGALVGMSEPK